MDFPSPTSPGFPHPPAVLTWLFALVCLGCDAPTSNPTAPSTASSAVTPVSTAATSAASERPRPRVPVRDQADLVLTPERRAAVEAAHPETKAFLDGLDIEERLYRKGLKHDDVKGAVAALDGLALGKWGYFVGNIIAPTAEGFDLAVRYVPREAGDAMGFTSAWLNVHFENIKGYEGSAYKAGDLIAVLARYAGKQKATNGYDVVALGDWPLGAHK